MMMHSPLADTTNRSSTSTLLDQDHLDQAGMVDLIVKKLGHELEEIRARSLDNLISKLNTDMISEQSLCHNRQLLVRLFDLLSMPQFSRVDSLLDLLIRLSRLKPAAVLIHDINGAHFLNVFKTSTTNETLKTKADQVINNLLEALIPADLDNSEYYDQFKSHFLATLLSSDDSMSTARATTSNLINGMNSSGLQSNHGTSVSLEISADSINSSRTLVNEEFHSIGRSSINSDRTNVNLFLSSNSSNRHHQSIKSNSTMPPNRVVVSTSASTQTFHWLPLAQIDKPFLTQTEDALKSEDSKKIRSYCNFLCTIVFNDFPAEVFLQRSTILKLLIDLMIKTTNSKSVESDESSSTLRHLLACIQFYCVKLKKRIVYIKDSSTLGYKDFYSNDFDYFSKSFTSKRSNRTMSSTQPPDSSRSNRSNKENMMLNTSLYSSHHDQQSMASTISSIKSMTIDQATSNKSKFKNVKSKIANGKSTVSKKQESSTSSMRSSSFDDPNSYEDNHSLPKVDETINNDLQDSIDVFLSEVNTKNYETDVNEKQAIRQSQEWSIYSFSFKLLSTLIDNMSLITIRSNSNNSQLKFSLLPSLCETINQVIDILAETKEEWRTSRSLQDQASEILQKLSISIKYCMSKVSPSSNQTLCVLNRLIYSFSVITLYKMVTLLAETVFLMPTELTETFFLVLNDQTVCDSFRPVSDTFANVLSHLDQSLYQIYLYSNEICESMKNACEFLLNYDQKNLAHDLVRMARSSLNYMDYHVCLDLTGKIIEFCSKLAHTDEVDHKTDIEYLVTSCMISKNDKIRTQAYSSIAGLVNHALDAQAVATEVNSKRYKSIDFLLLGKIFYQFVTFGLFDKCDQVKKCCRAVLAKLLHCELLVPECFRKKLTDLLALYMPFIQCFASQSDSLGQFVLSMSNDYYKSTEISDIVKPLLTPAVERLRSSLRYMYSKDKGLRKQGFQQSIGFLAKYLNKQTRDANLSNLNDFYLRFMPDKYCDMLVLLRRNNQIFMSSNNQTVVFETENLYRIFELFASEHVETSVRVNAGEKLAIMLSSGDQRLLEAFLGSDGPSFCIRFLKNSLLKAQSNQLYGEVDRMHAICFKCLSNMFYWSRKTRESVINDVEFYQLVIKSVLACYEAKIRKSPPSGTVPLDFYLTAQEDLSILLFLVLYDRVSTLEYYHSSSSVKKFDLSLSLKESLITPFDLTNSNKSLSSNNDLASVSSHQLDIVALENDRQTAYDVNYKLSELLKQRWENFNQDRVINFNSFNASLANSTLDVRLRDILDEKFRLFWNFKWHGGSMLKLAYDLFYQEQLVHNSQLNNFSPSLILNESDKLLVKFTSPIFLFKHFFAHLKSAKTHDDALNTLDLIQILITVIDQSRYDLGLGSSSSLYGDEYDQEFYIKHTLSYYFNRFKCDWHLSIDRFTSIMPVSKSDHKLYSSAFRVLLRMLRLQYLFETSSMNGVDKEEEPEFLLIDEWLFNMIFSPTSTLISMIRNLIVNYDSDDSTNNSTLLPLIEFIKSYYERFGIESLHRKQRSFTTDTDILNQLRLPAPELLKICIIQLQEYEVANFRNLNKLALVMSLIESTLCVPPISDSQISLVPQTSKLYIQLIKSLIHIINSFNAGRGGLSLSYMGNFITKSAQVSVLQLLRGSLSNSQTSFRNDIVKAVLCLKYAETNLYGSSWLVPLMLHRDSQIRSISFSIVSVLVETPLGREKLLADHTGIWSIAFNILLDQLESSFVRSQACTLLINLIQYSKPDDELVISNLQCLLVEHNFYQELGSILSTFYPFRVYSIDDLRSKAHKKNQVDTSEEISLCSPLLVRAICQLLYNIAALANKEAILAANNHGLLGLLVKYLKPKDLIGEDPDDELVYMLAWICKYLTLCCQIEQNCILMLIRNATHLDLIESLSKKSAKTRTKLKPFYEAMFDLLSTLLSLNDEKAMLDNCLISIFKTGIDCSFLLERFLVQDILTCKIPSVDDENPLFESAMRFYSIYWSRLTQLTPSYLKNSDEALVRVLGQKIAYYFDCIDFDQESIGTAMAKKLINSFEEYSREDLTPSLRQSYYNMLKSLFALSKTAQQQAFNAGLVESLVTNLKTTQSKLSWKSVSFDKVQLKESQLMGDLQQTLLMIKYLMHDNMVIKESVAKSSLHSLIHSLWCWAIQDPSLLKACLSTLCTLTANNSIAVNLMATSNIQAQTSNILSEPRAVSSLSSITSSTASISSLASASFNNTISLLNQVIKTLQKSMTMSQSTNKTSAVAIQKYAFALVTNCAQSHDCKSIIWKSNLLQDFVNTEFQLNKSSMRSEKLWLSFLTSLSFSPDGQLMLIKVDGLVNSVIKFLDYLGQQQSPQHVEIQHLAMLILRNLALNPANKSKLVSNADYLPIMIQSLQSKNEYLQLLTLAALEALIFDYQKGRVVLKNANLIKYFVMLNEQHCKKARTNSTSSRIVSLLCNLINSLNEQIIA